LKLANYSHSECNSPTNYFAAKREPLILIDEAEIRKDLALNKENEV